MNNFDIDDILSAVNNMNDGGESVQSILGDLHHRSPVVKTADSNPVGKNNNSSISGSKQTINRPVDPTKSISSSDNNTSSLDDCDQKLPDMKPFTQNIPPGRNQRENLTQMLHTKNIGNIGNASRGPRFNGSNQLIATKKKNSPITDIGDNSQKQDPDTIIPTDDGKKSLNGSHMTSLLGYNIPTSTLYFITVMIIITISLYFLTAEKKKDKDKEKKKDSE